MKILNNISKGTNKKKKREKNNYYVTKLKSTILKTDILRKTMRKMLNLPIHMNKDQKKGNKMTKEHNNKSITALTINQ